MSIAGQSRRFDPPPVTSGLPRTTDITRSTRVVRSVPRTDIGGRRSARPRIGARFSLLSRPARHSRVKESTPSTLVQLFLAEQVRIVAIAGIAVVANRARVRRVRAAPGGRPRSTSLERRPATLLLHHRPRPRQRVCGRNFGTLYSRQTHGDFGINHGSATLAGEERFTVPAAGARCLS